MSSKHASAANGAAPRSPMWFGSAAVQDEVLEANATGELPRNGQLHCLSQNIAARSGMLQRGTQP